MASHVERGRLAESIASAFLELCGYRVLERNVRFGHLELDLVARRANLIVFVEVKYRRDRRGGGAAAAVGARKRDDLESAAVGYLRLRGLRRVTVRFDVIVLESLPGEEPGFTLRHIRSAWRASGRYRL